MIVRRGRPRPWRWFREIGGDQSGATIVEFSLVFPVFLLMVFGTFELAVIIFISGSIEAAILEASRFGSTGETTGGLSRAERVLDIVEENTYGLVDMDAVELDTLVYDSFADIGQPEPFEDDNGNYSYDLGELFTDINGNGVWDADMGAAGLGGPDEIVLYRVRYSWGIMTPFIAGVLGDDFRYVASVAVRNEPF